METNQTSTSSGASAMDAVDLLKADHQKVKQLFEQLDALTQQGVSGEEKQALVTQIRDELSVHESVENDVFFPAVREVLRKKDVLNEAAEDQADAGDAIRELGTLQPADPEYDQKLSDLGDRIAEHAEEEEKDVFPQVSASSIDTEKLGEAMTAHKEELKKD